MEWNSLVSPCRFAASAGERFRGRLTTEDARRVANCADPSARTTPGGEKDMRGIRRRELIKTATVGGIALSLGGTQGLLVANQEARAQEAPLRAASWPNRQLLDLLKIEHPLIQAPM